MTISAALKRIYASAPHGQRYVETLELAHPSFAQTYYLTNDFEEWVFQDEGATPHVFQRVPFTLKLPKHDGEGRQDLQVAISNIGRELIDQIELAIQAPRSPIKCVYRVYLNTANSTPQNNPPLELSILTLDVNTEAVTATATRSDILNKRFPADVYRIDNFPGLNR